jgi:urease accessory protein
MKRYAWGLLMLLSSAAEAHTGIGTAGGMLTGLVHPLLGADHVVAMLAVGLWSVQRGGRRLWLLPAVFVTFMATGALLAMAGFSTAHTETGILLSDVVLVLFVVCAMRMSMFGSMLAVALFAYFHGAAHGSEAPLQADGFAYIVGFCTATALLHLLGIGAGMLLKNTRLMRRGWFSASRA